ncbi:extensin family protein [Bosea sp. BH3]|uniref:extensin-like domain-containing protein n=1 Tax=Bosea sp. BH3 TaxID=2871701 RepID=UPI0021CB825C|nr:extensin family protein [Bosea sp. BH3]MCU4179505.1 extensin family protein [Bosea sp. BH3]
MAARFRERGFVVRALLSGLLALTFVPAVLAAAPRERQGQPASSNAPKPTTVAAPLPPPRPAALPTPAKAAEPASVETPAEPERPAGPPICYAVFAERGGEALPTPATETQRPECAIEDPVTFREVNLPDGGKVTLDSAITVRCSFAVELAAWIRDDLSALAQKENTRLAKLTGVGGHACRPRNGVAGAPISEHASGNALDLFGLAFQDGRSVSLAGKEPELKPLREAIQRSVCGRFTTVLGPGADASHKDHLHFDLKERARGLRMCQWAVE